jgi:hypothetical protein
MIGILALALLVLDDFAQGWGTAKFTAYVPTLGDLMDVVLFALVFLTRTRWLAAFRSSNSTLVTARALGAGFYALGEFSDASTVMQVVRPLFAYFGMSSGLNILGALFLVGALCMLALGYRELQEALGER